jgi:hypothetical protein
MEIHAEVDLPKRTAPDKVALPPPDRRILLPSASSFSLYTATSVRSRGSGHGGRWRPRRRRQEAARGRGALGRHPEQPHPARPAEAAADPVPEPSTTRGSEGRGGGSGGLVERGGARAEGDGAAHGVEQLVEPAAVAAAAAACVVAPHGVTGRRRRGAEGVGDRIEWGNWGFGDFLGFDLCGVPQ